MYRISELEHPRIAYRGNGMVQIFESKRRRRFGRNGGARETMTREFPPRFEQAFGGMLRGCGYDAPPLTETGDMGILTIFLLGPHPPALAREQ